MLVSVIICTFNRASSLAKLLETLCGQRDVDFHDIEVLVVDNNSSDDTAAVAERFAARLPLRYIHEAQQGLAVARNRGIAESHGDVLLFVDDDVRLDDYWLRAYLDAFQDYPAAGFFGGRILPDWTDCPRPSWLKDERLPLLNSVLMNFDFGSDTRPYSNGDEGPIGASFAVRQVLFRELGEFRRDLGVVGTCRGRGEETEFLSRARELGAKGIYVGRALCLHRVYRKRLTLLELYRYGVASGVAHRKLSKNPERGSVLMAGFIVLRALPQLVKGRRDRFRQSIINSGIQVGMM